MLDKQVPLAVQESTTLSRRDIANRPSSTHGIEKLSFVLCPSPRTRRQIRKVERVVTRSPASCSRKVAHFSNYEPTFCCACPCGIDNFAGFPDLTDPRDDPGEPPEAVNLLACKNVLACCRSIDIRENSSRRETDSQRGSVVKSKSIPLCPANCALCCRSDDQCDDQPPILQHRQLQCVVASHANTARFGRNDVIPQKRMLLQHCLRRLDLISKLLAPCVQVG